MKKTKKLAALIVAFALILTLFAFAPISVSAAGDAYSTISAGWFHTMAIKNDGSLWSHGRNFSGELGDGTNTDKHTPTKIMDDVAQISAGALHTLGIKNDGSLWAWGSNYYGQLGDGTTEERHTPTKIMDDVAQVSVGSSHTVAIKNDGSLWAWGYNRSGQLGDGTTEERHTPVKVMDDVAQVSAGGGHTVAVKNDGSLWTWGWNQYSQLGDGTTEDRHTPTKIMDDVAQVSVGGSHTLAIKSDGSLWAWGWNSTGQLGNGTTEDRHTPTKIMDDVAQVSAGADHTVAVKNDGSLWAWGWNSTGQLGDGTTEDRHTPVKIMDDVAQVSAGGSHTVAVKSEGSLWAWGNNGFGQLGDGTRTTHDDEWNMIENNDKSMPTKIMDGVMLANNAGATPADPDPESEYIYDITDPGETVSLPLHLLPDITDQAGAVAAIEAAAAGMTAEQKDSATGVDLVTLFAEEAAAQAASAAVAGNSVTIDQATLQPLQATAGDARDAAEQALSASGIDARRELRASAKLRTSAASATITIDPSAIGAGLDSVRVETPGFAVTFTAAFIGENAADSPMVVTISQSGAAPSPLLSAFSPNSTRSDGIQDPRRKTAAIGGGFGKALAAADEKTYTITFDPPPTGYIGISLPPVPGDPTYQAIFDSDGNAIGGKYNPATKMLEAKVNRTQTVTVRDNKKDFSDIAKKPAEMKKAIEYLASKGVISGMTDTTFGPDSPITRAQIAALLTRALYMYDDDADGGFTDVKRADWYFGACGSAKRHGLMNGTSATTFAPGVNIPKDQIVCVAARALRSEMKYKNPSNVSGVLSVYTDAASLADWSLADIALATRERLVARRSDGAFRPAAAMMRGDAAILLYRLFQMIW